MTGSSSQNDTNVGAQEPQANYHQTYTFIATLESVVDSTWYIDSGATNHITSNLKNLTLKSRYRGNDKLIVGNGNQPAISHIGNTLVKSLTQPYQKLHLNNILHVPQIAKNLLSVSKFTYDNQAIAKFYDNECVVKDLKMRRILLR